MSFGIFFFIISVIWVSVNAKVYSYDAASKLNTDFDIDFSTKKGVVSVQVYYEVLCPYCIDFKTKILKNVLLKLGSYVDIKTYPYGNAKTTVDDQGKITFKCQHGEAECYGNKLHACALDIITNHTEALLYNICMMEDESGGESDDNAADKCAKLRSLDAEPIKNCAKSEKGLKLLKYYGDETQKVTKSGVPWILVNGKVFEDRNNLFAYVCKQLKNPPSECSSKTMY